MSEIAKKFSLAGRTGLVTGASRGLGRAIAIALGEAGADVVCVSSRPGGCAETAAAIRSTGREAWELAADAANRDELWCMADDAERLAGSIDILVNNAGTIFRQAAAEYPMEKWDLIIRTNLDSVFLLSQRFGRQMVARRHGKIVNIASLLSFSGGVTVPAYTASKHAVAGLTKALANEWAASGVQVNAVAPGYIRTDNTRALRDDPVRSKELLARIPAQRWGEPEDIAGAVVFLSSPASDYINGHLLVVDGGWMAR
jgi:2-dehydro-3-deoxy-D-gluconate 5-dehydrogenase